MESGPSMHLGEDEQDNELIILRLDIYYKRPGFPMALLYSLSGKVYLKMSLSTAARRIPARRSWVSTVSAQSLA